MAEQANSFFESGAEIQWWGFAAGIGLFLFGLHLLEVALQALAGRDFKTFNGGYPGVT